MAILADVGRIGVFGLKILWPEGRAGPIPAPGTAIAFGNPALTVRRVAERLVLLAVIIWSCWQRMHASVGV